MRKITKGIASLVIAMGLAAAPSSAMAQTDAPHVITPSPDTGSSCGSSNLATTCFLIVGSGTYVQYMENTTQWNGSAANTHLEINGPGGTWNSGTGTSVSQFTVTLNGYVLPGNYCGTSWYYNSGYYAAAQSCVLVHT